MMFTALNKNYLYGMEDWTATVECSRVDLPNAPYFSMCFYLVSHHDVLDQHKTGEGYSISEYTTGMVITRGHTTIEDAKIEAAKILTSREAQFNQNLRSLPIINSPDNFYNE